MDPVSIATGMIVEAIERLLRGLGRRGPPARIEDDEEEQMEAAD